ncbi:MAG: hypothetical protein VW268_00850 [Rhodospirillaceae bacterium]
MGNAITIKKEMALTHAGFWRGIAKALGTDAFQRTDDSVVLEGAGKRFEIIIGPERERCIARMVVEFVDVTLTFTGYTETERAAALGAFDRAFQRGGG